MQGKPEIGLINVIAKALAESVEAKWDAKDFNETQNGETPDEQREYFRALAIMAIQTGFPELSARLATCEAALREIAAIENQDNGGDWDEIEQARVIARKALEAK